MNMKTNSIMAIFVTLIVILALNPRMVSNIYDTILGRLVLIGVVVFLSMKSVTLGLLVALTIISGLNQFGSFVEGFETPTTIGEDNVPTTGKQVVLTDSETEKVNNAKKTISDLKAQAQSQGIDKEDIKTAIMAKDSSTIQTDPNMTTNENVEAFSTNMFTSLKDGFYSAAPAF
jgi:hypothetical protein